MTRRRLAAAWTLIALCLLCGLSTAPFAVGQVAAPAAGAKTGAEQSNKSDDAIAQVKALQKQLLQAILKSDTSFLEKYYAEDYTAIHGDGKLSTKAEEIANFASGVTKYESIEVRESKARAYGDTVIINGRVFVKTTVNGKPYSGEVSNTRVWVKQNGEWKVAAWQATRVASPAQ